MSKLDLTVASIRDETASIRRITLARSDRAVLPSFEAGAHVTLDIPAVGARKYSLVNTATDLTAIAAPRTYTLGIRIEPKGGGGSRYMHGLQVGDVIAAEPPQNNFPLMVGAEPIALVGGGIGITPLISMAATLRATGKAFTMVYAARTESELAFLSEISALAGDALLIHTDETAGRVFNMAAHFASLPDRAKVYMCGPKPMLKAGMDAAKALGWSRDRVVFELFYSVAPARAVNHG